jgi:hypothetical protein
VKHRQKNVGRLKRILDGKRILLAIGLTLVLPALVLSQTNGKNAGKKSSDEQAVLQTLNDLGDGLGKNDTAVLDRIYADNYTFIGDTGMIMTKAQRIDAVKSGDLKYESFSHEVASVHLFGNTAIIVTRISTKMAPGLKFASGKFITSCTFVKIKGRWQLVAAHNTRTGDL